jgi:micrococcal nuclease
MQRSSTKTNLRNPLFYLTMSLGICAALLTHTIAELDTPPVAEQAFSYTPYHYKAEVVSIYDADTLTLSVDVGFNIKVKEKFRLSRINAWEVRGDEREKGILARNWLRRTCPVGSTLYLETEKDSKGKYGRYLTEIFIPRGDDWRNLNDELVTLNHAIYRAY